MLNSFKNYQPSSQNPTTSKSDATVPPWHSFGMLLEVIGIGVIPLFVSALTNPDMLLEYEWAGPWLSAGV